MRGWCLTARLASFLGCSEVQEGPHQAHEMLWSFQGFVSFCCSLSCLQTPCLPEERRNPSPLNECLDIIHSLGEALSSLLAIQTLVSSAWVPRGGGCGDGGGLWLEMTLWPGAAILDPEPCAQPVPHSAKLPPMLGPLHSSLPVAVQLGSGSQIYAGDRGLQGGDPSGLKPPSELPGEEEEEWRDVGKCAQHQDRSHWSVMCALGVCTNLICLACLLPAFYNGCLTPLPSPSAKCTHIHTEALHGLPSDVKTEPKLFIWVGKEPRVENST